MFHSCFTHVSLSTSTVKVPTSLSRIQHLHNVAQPNMAQHNLQWSSMAQLCPLQSPAVFAVPAVPAPVPDLIKTQQSWNLAATILLAHGWPAAATQDQNIREILPLFCSIGFATCFHLGPLVVACVLCCCMNLTPFLLQIST